MRSGLRPHRMIELLERRRLLSAGDLDVDFATFGQLRLDHPTNRVSSAVQSDGKTIIAATIGDDRGQNRQLYIARLNVNGSLDDSFASHGEYRLSIAGANDDLYLNQADVALRSDGRIVGVGGTAIVQLTHTGQ